MYNKQYHTNELFNLSLESGNIVSMLILEHLDRETWSGVLDTKQDILYLTISDRLLIYGVTEKRYMMKDFSFYRPIGLWVVE
jgi:hypothetical protein